MPKLVDRDQRREQIVDATWRIIERGGFESATMREIAAEAGFAHGALQRYFPNKKRLLAAAFIRAHARANARADDTRGDRRGLAALRALCLEIMPLGEEKLREARVTVAFWDRAIQDQGLRQAHRDNALVRRGHMYAFLAQAHKDGEIGPDVDDEVVVDQLTAMNAGLQILSILMPDTTTQERQLHALDAYLGGLRATATAAAR